MPQLIGVECRVCGTRLYGRSDQVGNKIKCPDCGAGTVLPEPAPPKPKHMPAALEGEQYELWDADDQPLPSEIIAAQPKYIAVTCKKCASLMYANEVQVGQQMVCPDCGTRNTIPPAPRPAEKRSVLTPDRETPQLDLAAAPGDRPHIIPHTLGLTLAEQHKEAEYEAALEKSQRTGKPITIDTRGRPVLPRFPLLTDVIAFPFTSGVPIRWLVLTFGLVVWGGLLTDGIQAWIAWNGKSGSGEAIFAGLAETFIGAPLALVWYASVSSIFMAVVAQSAVGARRVEDWPSLNFIYSMSEMLPVGIAVAFCAAPGWVLGHLISEEVWLEFVLGGITLVFGLPITLLSQLAGTSTWELVDLKVLGAAVRCPFSMMLFYLQSACLLAICVAAIYITGQRDIYLILTTAPLIVLCIIYYARLLGRLGWRIAEKIKIDEPDEAPRSAGPKNYNPPRGKKMPT